MPVTVPDRFHNVTLAGNTAGALAEISSGTLTIAGGNNITLSQNGNAVTISGANIGGAQTGISGLANSETTYTSGSVTLSALANITIRSTTGQQFQFSVAAQSAESQSIGMSNLGNTSGTTGVASGAQVQYVLAGGNNVTLSQSLNGASGTVTISAFNQTQESNTIGMSNIGNTSGDTAIRSGNQLRIVFAGGNNITLSQSTNGSSATVTISAANSAAQTQESNTIGMSNIGNTSGDTAIRSAAQLQIVLAGGNNITLSQSTNGSSATITVSAFNQSAESNTIGMSNIGNTSGDTAIRSGNQLRIVFAGGNNITLSQSTNGSSATVTISAFNQTSPVVGSAIQSVSSATDSGTATSQFAAHDHKHAGVGPLGVSTGGNTSGDTGTQYGRVVFAGGNNITLSVSSSNNGAQTITISAPNLGAGAGYTAGMSNLGNTDGTTGMADSRLVIVGSDGIKLSQSLDAANHSGTISIINSWSTATTVSAVESANVVGANAGRFALEGHQHEGVFSVGVSTGGNTAGNTTVEAGRWVFQGDGNITLSVSTAANNRNTLEVSGPGPMNYWQLYPQYSFVSSQMGQSSMLVFPMDLREAIQFDRALAYVSISQSTSSNSSYSIAIEFHCGIYTKTGSTLSLLKSGSANNAWSMTSNNTTANQAGIRMITAAIQSTITAGDYWIAFLSVTKSTNANWATIANGAPNVNGSQFSGPLGVASNKSYQHVVGYGVLSVATAAIPNSLGFSDISNAGNAAMRSAIYLNLANGTV